MGSSAGPRGRSFRCTRAPGWAKPGPVPRPLPRPSAPGSGQLPLTAQLARDCSRVTSLFSDSPLSPEAARHGGGSSTAPAASGPRPGGCGQNPRRRGAARAPAPGAPVTHGNLSHLHSPGSWGAFPQTPRCEAECWPEGTGPRRSAPRPPRTPRGRARAPGAACRPFCPPSPSQPESPEGAAESPPQSPWNQNTEGAENGRKGRWKNPDGEGEFHVGKEQMTIFKETYKI